jgi:hypothetical protein
VVARDQLLGLISAVAQGDAAREDVVAALRDKGVDSLDVMVAFMSEMVRRDRDPGHRARLVNVRRAASPAAREPSPPSVHRPGVLPFLLQGTLYDPADIERFQGQELHFIPAAAGDHIIVIDDRDIVESWRQLSYLSSNVNPAPVSSIPPRQQRTYFYEDIGYSGPYLEVPKDRGYYDLTEVGFFSDWNDCISSVVNYGTTFTVLHEHIHWTGSTWTTCGCDFDLGVHGWNDRASSVETW